MRAVSDAVEVPVIASGGVGNLDHLADGILLGGADAVLAASIFHYGEYTIAQAKQHLAALLPQSLHGQNEQQAEGGVDHPHHRLLEAQGQGGLQIGVQNAGVQQGLERQAQEQPVGNRG